MGLVRAQTYIWEGHRPTYGREYGASEGTDLHMGGSMGLVRAQTYIWEGVWG